MPPSIGVSGGVGRDWGEIVFDLPFIGHTVKVGVIFHGAGEINFDFQVIVQSVSIAVGVGGAGVEGGGVHETDAVVAKLVAVG